MKKPPIALITGITGQDGAYLAQLLARKGLRGLRHLPPHEFGQLLAHRRTRHPGSSESALVEYDLTDLGASTQPGRGGRSRTRSTTWPRRASSACRSNSRSPPRRSPALGALNLLEAIRIVNPNDPLLPGVDLGDVRQGAGSAAGREHAVLSAQPVRRGQAVRALDDGQLSRVVRHLRCSGILFNHESPLRGPRVRHAQDHRRRREDQARQARRAGARQPRREARLGLCAGVRRRHVADAAGAPSPTRSCWRPTGRETVRDFVTMALPAPA